MVSDKYLLDSDPERMAAARYAAEDFARGIGLDRRAALRLNLLVEETLGMVKAMVDEFYGQLWFAGNGKACEIHLEATANLDAARRQELLSVSSTGMNASARGFMSMIGGVIMSALYAYGKETIRYGLVHAEGSTSPSGSKLTPIWSLSTYRGNLDKARSENADTAAAWDELEKSVVASLADDVVVGIRGDRIEMIIAKDFRR